jgi:hypothetical protein
MAIVGKKIPAGTCLKIKDATTCISGGFTIIPNVHAVSRIFMNAVRMSRNTFSHIAVGLDSNGSLSRHEGKERHLLAQPVIVASEGIAFLK